MGRSKTSHTALNWTALNWDVFTIKRPGLSRDLPAGREELMWVANSSTLLYGEQDAVLVDTFLTIEQSQILVDRILASGKNLTAIYITHAHGDHFFGLAPLLKSRMTRTAKHSSTKKHWRLPRPRSTAHHSPRCRFSSGIWGISGVVDMAGIPDAHASIWKTYC